MHELSRADAGRTIGRIHNSLGHILSKAIETSKHRGAVLSIDRGAWRLRGVSIMVLFTPTSTLSDSVLQHPLL